MLSQEGAIENPTEGTVRWFEEKIKALSAQATVDKARQDRTRAIQSRTRRLTLNSQESKVRLRRLRGRTKSGCNERVKATLCVRSVLRQSKGGAEHP